MVCNRASISYKYFRDQDIVFFKIQSNAETVDFSWSRSLLFSALHINHRCNFCFSCSGKGGAPILNTGYIGLCHCPGYAFQAFSQEQGV